VSVPNRDQSEHWNNPDEVGQWIDEKLQHDQMLEPFVSMLIDGAQLTAGNDVLDIGCGTGLCGPLLAPYARHLVGVDLSRGMLEHARGKKVYDELVHAELTAYLRQLDRSFDVIVTADTLVYFGALDDVIAAAASVLRPGGVLVFTVEEDVEGASDSYCLRPHGRYTHRAEYVERLLVAAGLQPTVGRAELRKESGRPVAGLVVTAKKQAGAHV